MSLLIFLVIPSLKCSALCYRPRLSKPHGGIGTAIIGLTATAVVVLVPMERL
jgi:hypothetical protein